MPVSLIPPTKPKPKKIKKGKIGALVLKGTREPKKLVYFLIFLIGTILIFSFYGIVKSYQTSLKNKITRLEDEGKTLEAEKRELRETTSVIGFQAKLDILGSVIDSHISWEGVLGFLEELTLPKVKYDSFSSNGSERSLRLSGVTTNFTNLAEQMLVFKNHNLVESFKLTGFGMSDDGIRFDIDLALSQEAWEGGSKEDES